MKDLHLGGPLQPFPVAVYPCPILRNQIYQGDSFLCDPNARNLLWGLIEVAFCARRYSLSPERTKAAQKKGCS